MLTSLECLVNPYISQLSPIFEEAVKGGYLIKRKDGTPWQYVRYSLTNSTALNVPQMGPVAARSGHR